MEYLYLFIVIILIVLAISDLVVGVSNDAVNFVNSAVGSRVASFRVIMIVAAAGVLVGATFSSGMMEVARKGIFNPEQFFFSEIMIIFLAVMITDVILLDLFNTAGLPTSTTVSLIFELLGASMAVSALKIMQQGGSIQELGQYINSGKVVAIITGILISIAIAFTMGSLIQYFVRLLFTFNFQRKIRYFGAAWGGIAISIMVYFLFIKGAKGSSFISAETVRWFTTNTFLILLVTFAGVTILLQALQWIFRIDVLKLVVLSGTFCLAMAFAGNDLVNFIGVPLAGLESFQAMMASGVGPDLFSMGLLNDPVKTPTLLLLIAGLIMVTTLFLSSKARKVTKTEVSLGKQDEGDEMFQSSMVSRGIVNIFLMMNTGFRAIVPAVVLNKMQTRFSQPRKKQWKNENLPAFDMIRASVNLMVSSMLIALGTSLKLPLSTTYVTFMVAMGTSLSDRAWGRETAVYRVNGVITVVGGWFFTAFSAFTAAFLFATGIYYGGVFAIIALIGLALFFAYRTNIYHRMKTREEKLEESGDLMGSTDSSTIFKLSETALLSAFPKVEGLLYSILAAFVTDDRKKLFKQEKKLKDLSREVKLIRKRFHPAVRTFEEDKTDSGYYFITVHHILKDLQGSVQKVYTQIFDYMLNRHHPPSAETGASLGEINALMQACLNQCLEIMRSHRFADTDLLDQQRDQLAGLISRMKREQITWMKENESGTRLSLLLLDVLQETGNVADQARKLVEIQRDFLKISEAV